MMKRFDSMFRMPGSAERLPMFETWISHKSGLPSRCMVESPVKFTISSQANHSPKILTWTRTVTTWLKNGCLASAIVATALSGTAKFQATGLYPVLDTIDGSSSVYLQQRHHDVIYNHIENIAVTIPTVVAQVTFDLVEFNDRLVARILIRTQHQAYIFGAMCPILHELRRRYWVMTTISRSHRTANSAFQRTGKSLLACWLGSTRGRRRRSISSS